jgi:hypothetical protein
VASGIAVPPPTPRELAAQLLKMVARGDIEVRLLPDRFTTAFSGRPLVSALTRLEAQEGAMLTTRRHSMFRADDLTRMLIAQLDGQHTLDDLVALLERWVADGKLNVKGPENRPADMHAVHVATINTVLANLRDQALLIG